MALDIPGRVGIEAVCVASPNYLPATVPMQMGNSLRIVIAGGVTKRTELARGFLNAMIQMGAPILTPKSMPAGVTMALALADELLAQSEECPTPTPQSPPAAMDATGIIVPAS